MPALSRSQSVECFSAIQNARLDPADWRFTTDVQTDASSSKMDRIEHLPTGSRFDVGFFQGGGYWLSHWPVLAAGKANLYRPEDTWAGTLQLFRSWLAHVKRDHGTPDLWAQLGQQAAIPNAASEERYTEPFSATELKLLDAGLDNIEQFIVATGPLDPGGLDFVRRRFAYLKEAARTTTRKIDWLNIFVGQAFGMVTAQVINPSSYQAIMTHAAAALQGVFNFGLRLLS